MAIDYVGFKVHAIKPGSDRPLISGSYYDCDVSDFFWQYSLTTWANGIFNPSVFYVVHHDERYTHNNGFLIYKVTLIYEYDAYYFE